MDTGWKAYEKALREKYADLPDGEMLKLKKEYYSGAAAACASIETNIRIATNTIRSPIAALREEIDRAES